MQYDQSVNFGSSFDERTISLIEWIQQIKGATSYKPKEIMRTSTGQIE